MEVIPMGSRGELGWDLQVTFPSDPWHSGLEVTVWEPKWAWGGGVRLGLPIILQTPLKQDGHPGSKPESRLWGFEVPCFKRKALQDPATLFCL